MGKIVNFKSYIIFLINCFFILTLLVPTSIINKIFFVLIFLAVFFTIREYYFNSKSPIYVILIFLYGYILSYFNNVDKELSNQFFLSTFVLILIYPIIYYKINLDKIVKISGLLLAIYSLISFFIVVVYLDSSISETYYTFFKEYSAGSNGLREFTDDGLLSFHTGTAPFLFLSLVLYFESFLNKKTILTFLAIILHIYIIFISGSRGTFFSSLLTIVMLMLFRSSNKIKFGILIFGIPLFILFISLLLKNTDIFSSDEGSNNVKIGHFDSFIESTNFFNLITGNGLAAKYFSKGTNSVLAHTEITPVDMIRYLGIVMAFLLYWFIIFPTKRIKSYLGNNFLYMVIFIIYVLNSMTNPTMFNSFGLLVVIWYWYKILKEGEENFISKIEA